MNNTPQTPSSKSGVGYLVVKASTARGAIPLSGASVNIRSADNGSSDIIYSLKTNIDGITQKVSLPAPARSLSKSPGNVIPYALYDVDIFKEGYTELYLTNVAIFEGITSIQGAVMIPLKANRYPDSYVADSGENPKDKNTVGGA